MPTLTVDGAPLFEALAIEMWLGETYGVQQGLWPAPGTPERLQAMAWSTWSYVTYGAQLVRLQAARDLGTPDDAHGTSAHKGLDQLLALLDARLAAQPWMLGQAYSLVDLIVGSVIALLVWRAIQSRSGDLHTLIAFDLSATHGGLAAELGRFRAASALAELAVRFIPPVPNPDLFEQVRQAVALIELAPPDAVDVVGLRALWRLIAELGLGPSLEECARDGVPIPPGDASFSLGDGGFLCAGCARGTGATRMAAEDRDALQALLVPGEQLPMLDGPHAAAHRRLLARWVGHHLSDGTLPALEAWRRAG